MSKYTVDVKALISIEVEADNEDAARSAADDYVETCLSPNEDEVNAWNQVQEEDDAPPILSASVWTVDGYSEVEEMGDE